MRMIRVSVVDGGLRMVNLKVAELQDNTQVLTSRRPLKALSNPVSDPS
jgi:hypothetical protein